MFVVKLCSCNFNILVILTVCTLGDIKEIKCIKVQVVNP